MAATHFLRARLGIARSGFLFSRGSGSENQNTKAWHCKSMRLAATRSLVSLLALFYVWFPGLAQAQPLAGPLPGPNVGDSVVLPMLRAPGPLALLPGGAKALLGEPDKLLLLDLNTQAVQIVTEGLKNPSRIAIEGEANTALIFQFGDARFSGDPTGQLLRVDLATGQKTVLTTNFAGPGGIAIEPPGQTALVRDKNGIYRVDLSTGVAVLLVSGFDGGDIAIEPGNASAIFPVVGTIGEIRRVNLMTNVVSLVPSQAFVRNGGIEISPDGSFVLVGGGGGGDTGITRVNLATGQTTQIFASGIALFCSHSLGDMALTPDGTEVVFTWGDVFAGIRVSRVRLSDNSRSDVAVAATSIAMSVEGPDKLLLANGAGCFGSLSRLDMTSGATDFIRTTETLFDLAYSPGLNDALITTVRRSSAAGDLTRINLTSQAINTIGINPAPFGVIVEATDTSALVTSGTTLQRVSLTTGQVAQLAQGLDSPAGIALDSTGQTAIVGSLTDKIVRVDLTTGNVSAIATGLSSPRYLAAEAGDGSVLVAEIGRGLSRVAIVYCVSRHS